MIVYGMELWREIVGYDQLKKTKKMREDGKMKTTCRQTTAVAGPFY